MPFKPYSLFVAGRYLQPGRRNRFINFITAIAVLGVMFGTASLLISLAILDGFDKTLRANMIAFVGHIEVTSFGRKPLSDYRQMLSTLPALAPEITGISPFVAREAIVRSRSGLEGILLRGVLADRDVSSIRNRMIAGRFAFPRRDSTQLPRLILGERLAVRLNVRQGDTIVVFAPNGVPTPANPPEIEQFVISGIYRTGLAEYDDIYVYTSLEAAQKIFAFADNEVSGYDILTNDVEKAEQTARKLDTLKGYPHYPRTVFDIFQSIFAWLDLQREPIPIVLGLISIVAGFNILSTLLMVVMEKTESVGVLSSLGARPGGIMAIFVGQGLIIGGVGTFLGAGLALAFTLIQMHYKVLALDADIYFIDAVPVALTPWHYALVITLSLVLCILSTIIPAWIASRLRPVEALRFR
jgi:lipoprotein-releasing system permease protein